MAPAFPVEGSKGEAEAGQEELNALRRALTAPTITAIAKHAVKEIAWQQGRAATLHAEMGRERRVGSARMCTSRCGRRKAGLLSTKDADWHVATDAPVPGGLLPCAELHLLPGALVNSYKRFQKGTFAPTKVWSVDNRTAGFRLCGDVHRRFASSAGSAGRTSIPTWRLPAMLAAGIAGIEEKMDCASHSRAMPMRARRQRNPVHAAGCDGDPAQVRKCCARPWGRSGRPLHQAAEWEQES